MSGAWEPGRETDTERTRNLLVDKLGAILPAEMWVVGDPTGGGKIVFWDGGHFWLVTVEAAQVALGYQGPG